MYEPSYYFWLAPYYFPSVLASDFSLAAVPSFGQCQAKNEEIMAQKRGSGPEEAWERVKEESSSRTSRFKYAKKNVESNVVNQVVSFLTIKEKSEGVLRRILGSAEKVEAFYEIMRQAKRQSKKYMGRKVLVGLLELGEGHPVRTLHGKLRSKIALRLGEIRRALAQMARYFLRSEVVPTLLTSSKLDKGTLQQHLLRAREILSYLSNKPYYSL